MNSPIKTILAAGCCLFIVRAQAQSITVSPEVKSAMDQVQAAGIKADIAYLADDKLKGRKPGTPGFQMAVDYVVEQLKLQGVKPAGEKGTWLQTVRFRKAFVKDPKLTLTQNGTSTPLAASDFTLNSNPVFPQLSVNAGVVFAGYGVSEPELGYDDYAGIDVKGKIVLIVRGVPERFSSSVAAHAQQASTILKKAAAHGAIGVIVGTPDSTVRAAGGFGGGAAGGGAGGAAPRGATSIMDEKGHAVVSSTYASDALKLYGTARFPLFKQLLQKDNKDIYAMVAQLKAGHPQSYALTGTLSGSYSSTYEDMVSYNVIGKIEGSDKKLKKEYVVHSAHLDHLGVGNAAQGDSIFNGAHDNASGVASLLGITKIYHSLKAKPKRSILVVFVTGEEMGDLGSGYFAKHPTVPQKRMVADVNTDMPTIIAPLLSVTALGAEHSSLAKTVDQAAGYFGMGVEPDPEPKQARFTRSDQYSFVVAGIPALHIKYGSRTPDGKNNLNDLVAVWRAKYYHKQADDINGIFDFEAGRTYAQLNFLIGYLVAQEPVRPVWNVGDIFAVKE